MKPKIIGLDAPKMPSDVGEGIFGYGMPDGSLGHSAFQQPRLFAGRQRQGVFFTPYSYKWYEAEEPELQWALEKRPGLPLFPGSDARGLVLVGPSMGAMEEGSKSLVTGLAIVAAIGLAYALLR